MFDKILVPVDRSTLAEHILPHVVAMAHAYNSQVLLISVLDPNVENRSLSPIDPLDWQIRRAEAEAYLSDLAGSLETRGLVVQTILLEGKAPDQVIRHANRLGSNLIMLNSHGQGGISGWNTSSVSTKIIQKARTSVMLVRAYPVADQDPTDIYYRRILAPVDGSKRAEYGLSTAAHLARKHEAELLIAHVIKPPELPRRTPLSARERSLVQEVVDSNRTEASQYLQTLEASLDCQVKTCILISESVQEALHQVIDQEKIDLMVLNAHGLSGNPRWPYGNVTVNFLAYSTIPLLIVQDFARDILVDPGAEILAKESLRRMPVTVIEDAQRYGGIPR